MKRIFSITAAMLMCFILASCGTATISGEPETYYSPDQTFSVDLPTSEENTWVVNEETAGNVLDVTDKSDTMKIYVQCMSKLQAGTIAPDLASYRDYAIMNTFSQLLGSVKMADTSVRVPDFIKESSAGSFTYEGAKGVAVFMESPRCYYTYIILAVEEAYDLNESVLLESVMSFKELTQ